MRPAQKSDTPYTLPIHVTSGPPIPEITLGNNLPPFTVSSSATFEVNASVTYAYALIPDVVFPLTRLRKGHILFIHSTGQRPGLSVRCADVESINRALQELESLPPDVERTIGPWNSARELASEFVLLGAFENEVGEVQSDVTYKAKGRVVNVVVHGLCLVDDHWPEANNGDTLWYVIKKTKDPPKPWAFVAVHTSPLSALSWKQLEGGEAVAVRVGTKLYAAHGIAHVLFGA